MVDGVLLPLSLNYNRFLQNRIGITPILSRVVWVYTPVTRKERKENATENIEPVRMQKISNTNFKPDRKRSNGATNGKLLYLVFKFHFGGDIEHDE